MFGCAGQSAAHHNFGPEPLESTILKITSKISVVIYSLLLLDNYSRTYCNRLIFSITGIDDQGLSKKNVSTETFFNFKILP